MVSRIGYEGLTRTPNAHRTILVDFADQTSPSVNATGTWLTGGTLVVTPVGTALREIEVTDGDATYMTINTTGDVGVDLTPGVWKCTLMGVAIANGGAATLRIGMHLEDNVSLAEIDQDGHGVIATGDAQWFNLTTVVDIGRDDTNTVLQVSLADGDGGLEVYDLNLLIEKVGSR